MPLVRKLLGGRVLDTGDLRFRWEPGKVLAEFGRSGRAQRISYRLDGDRLELVSSVATPAGVSAIGPELVALEILQRNRLTELVGFRLGKHDRLEGWVEQHSPTMHRDDLVFCLTLLAREADRFEQALTGVDEL